MKRAKVIAAAALGSILLASLPAMAGGHTWRVSEIFSNADGTVQFVELGECGGGAGEVATAGHTVTSNTKSMTVTANAVSPTSFKKILIGTPAFCALFNALPGSPTCDYILPVGSVPFMSLTADAIKYSTYDAAPGFVYTMGQLPTDGVNSRNKTGCGAPTVTIAANSPTNYAGGGGSVNASTPPPGVPDGTSGSTPMTASKLNPAGSSLSVAFDTATCSGSVTRQILYGQQANLPATPGGAFSLAGSACAIGSSPFTWNSVPGPTGGTGLVWWLITARDGSAREGSWGKNSALAERVGPGAGGSSGQCGVTSRNISNACGH